MGMKRGEGECVIRRESVPLKEVLWGIESGREQQANCDAAPGDPPGELPTGRRQPRRGGAVWR